MNCFFQYDRFQVAPRRFQNDAGGVKADFAARATGAGGKLFGIWSSVVGLGLARDEGIAVTSWPDEAACRAAPIVGDGIAGSERIVMEATVRPVSDNPPAYEGVYVFRWFDIDAADWPTFRDISDAAWPNMEAVFDANICGFWRSLDIAEPEARILLCTRYADLSVWEASRWWKNPAPEADASMGRFRKRNEIIKSTIAYPALPIS